tara:strand:+ start:6729 stop:7958 length:1230 start_codon:yes stop_codon:yes gene_type:complete
MSFEFPIKTATACQYKWTWSTVFLSTGTSSSCHRCKGWDVSDMMDDFHNHPGKISDREKMLKGERPGNGCEYCFKIEDAGGVSERTGFINKTDQMPPEIEKVEIGSPYPTSVTPRILEVYFNNLCNQKCVYCSPYFSSLIQQEVDKFGPLSDEYHLDGFEEKPGYEDRKEKFWQWMEKHSQNLYQFHILGGEPMYIPEFEETLEFFKTKKHPNMNFKIFSNLKYPTKKFIKKIALIQELIDSGYLKSFQVVCSIDNWGPQAEFARHGMKLKQWEANFNHLLLKTDTILNIHSTISPVTLPTMADLYRKVIEWGKVKDIEFGWNTIAHPRFMAPEILGHHAAPYFDELLSVVPDKNDWHEVLNGFKTQVVNHKVDNERILKLTNYLDSIDKRRDTDWKSLYPYLNEIKTD